MKEDFGSSKLWIRLVAALFCLALAPLTRADLFPPDVDDPATLHIGPDNCIVSGCPKIWNGNELNLILGTWNSPETLNLRQTSGGLRI